MSRSAPLLLLLLALTIPAASGAQPKFELDGNALKLPGPIAFEAGSDRLTGVSFQTLEHVKAYLDAAPHVTLLRIESHTDRDGAEAFNRALSARRAAAAAKWLVAHGVDCKRLLPVGFGSTKPVAGGSPAEARARSSRTLVVNAALRGKPIGGMPVDGGGKVAGDPCR
jgi:OmpA-OmpF porin, OOP family